MSKFSEFLSSGVAEHYVPPGTSIFFKRMKKWINRKSQLKNLVTNSGIFSPKFSKLKAQLKELSRLKIFSKLNWFSHKIWIYRKT